jgi:hypothetical protein
MIWRPVAAILGYVLYFVLTLDWRLVLAVLCVIGVLATGCRHRTVEPFAFAGTAIALLLWSDRAREARQDAIRQRHSTPPSPEFIARRTAVIQTIRSRGEPAVLSLEEFFDGNTDYGSIGCNLIMSPGPSGFFTVLQAIRARPEVQDVLVKVRDAPVTEENAFAWPFSDTIFLLTSAPREEVARWLKPLRPDEVGYVEASASTALPPAAPALAPEIRALYAWWD